MNDIVTLRTLVDQISETTGCDKSVSNEFVQAFSSLVKECIKSGQQATVKGIGTFSVVSTPSGKNIAYTPDREMADGVNSPFAMFVPVELAPKQDSDGDSDPKAAERTNGSPYSDANAMVEASPNTASVLEGEASKQHPSPTGTDDGPIESSGIENQTSDPVNPTVETENETPGAVRPEINAEKHASEAEVPKNVANPTLAQDNIKKDAADEPNHSGQSSSETVFSGNQAHPDSEQDYDIADAEAAEPERSGFPFYISICALMVGLLLGLIAGFYLHDPIINMLNPQETEVAPILGDEHINSNDISELNTPATTPADEAEKASAPTDEPADAAEPASTEDTQANAYSTGGNSQAESTQAESVDGSIAEVWDVVPQGKNLVYLSQKHYGHKEFWVYIYLENKDKISNPSQVSAGMRVRIPPLAKYAKSPDMEENIANAKDEGNAILRQQK